MFPSPNAFFGRGEYCSTQPISSSTTHSIAPDSSFHPMLSSLDQQRSQIISLCRRDNLQACCGLAAMISSINFSIAPVSVTCFKPRFSMISSTSPSLFHSASKIVLAILPEMCHPQCAQLICLIALRKQDFH